MPAQVCKEINSAPVCDAAKHALATVVGIS